MSESQHSHQSGVSSTFSHTTSAPQSTNPFTADLKGEFTSNFGTNTNAVSQIFKDGGFVSQNRAKWILLGVLVVILLVGGYFLFSGDDSDFDEFASDQSSEETAAQDPAATEGNKNATAEEGNAENTESANTATEAPTAAATSAAQAPSVGTGTIVLSEPADGAARNYDETTGSAMFSWQGGAGYIVLSRSPSMKPEYFRMMSSSGSFKFRNPYPGTWYWKVENADGSSEVRRFTVKPPERRNITLAEPASGASLSGSGGMVSWKGDNKVAFYRVEMTKGQSWANVEYRFATAGNKVQVQGVNPGQYQLRVGAFSEVSGRWEFTQPVTVTVQ